MATSRQRLTFYPFAYALLTEEASQYCWYCLDQMAEKKRCLGCGVAIFCNKDCQQLGWKDHKAECSGIRTKGILPNIETRILGRIVLRYKDILSGKDKKDPNFYKDRGSKRSIMDIWAHTKEMSNDPYAMKKFIEVISSLESFYDAKHLLEREIVFELHCRDYINRHAISDKAYMKEIGKGLYLDLCAYDHSCRPNTIYTCTGFVATLRGLSSTMNITDRTTTFYSYTDLLCSFQERQKMLKDTWYFDCQCDRCKDKGDHILSSVLCPTCENYKTTLCIFGEYEYKDKSTNIITCPVCKNALAKEYVIEAIAAMRFVDKLITNKELDQMPLKTRKSFLEDLLERYQKILPTVNVYLCKIIQNLIGLVEAINQEELLRLHLLSEECVRFCFPKNHPAIAFHLRNIAIFCQSLSKIDKAKEYFKEAQEILDFTLDPDHPMAQENRQMLNSMEDSLEEVNGKVAHLKESASAAETTGTGSTSSECGHISNTCESTVNGTVERITEPLKQMSPAQQLRDPAYHMPNDKTKTETETIQQPRKPIVICSSDLFNEDLDDLPSLVS